MKKMQKIISSWLVCCLLLTLVPMQAFAQEETEPAAETVAETEIEPAEETEEETEPVELIVEETVQSAQIAAEEAVNAAVATQNETWIQQQIENGMTEIYIDEPIVLEHDYILSGHVRLYIIRNGSITVPAGKTLTNQGAQINVWEGGSLTVENGGCFVNRSEIRVAGTFAVYGTFEGIVHTYDLWTDTNIIGVPASAIWMHYVVDEGSNEANQAKFLENWALMESTNYRYYSQQIHGDLTLPCDLVIPVNCWFVLENEILTLTIPRGCKITNYGTFEVHEDQTVENYGFFDNAGNLDMQGNWVGKKAVSEYEDESWIQQQINNGLTEIYIDDDIILKNDFTINSRVRLYVRDGSITVPAGKTLTNEAAQIRVWENGSIFVENQGTFVNRSEVTIDGTLSVKGTFDGMVHTYYWTDRTNATIIGVPDDLIWMHYVVQEGSNRANQTKLLENWALMESSNYGRYSQQIHGDLTLPSDLVIPDNCWFVLEVNSFTLTIPAGCQITNYGTFRIFEDQTVANYGTFENVGNLDIQGNWIGNSPVCENESWIQHQINSGKTELDLDTDIVLSDDFLLPGNVFLRFNGHTITVPAGVTFTVNGQLGNWWEQGGLIVEPGGELINEGYIGSTGILDIRGNFSGNYIHTCYEPGGMPADITGLADEDIWMHYVMHYNNPNEDHEDIFLECLDLMNSTDYGWYSFQLHGTLELPCDLVIPENCSFFLESRTFTLTIPAGRKITNYGEFYSDGDQTVVNNGTFENGGYMEVLGNWIGNQPVKLQMTQDQLEEALAGAEYYHLNAEVTLERDMTLTTHLYIRPGAKLVVPKGVKLTVENNVTVVWGGTLDIQGEYELIPPENGHRSIGLCLEDGTYSTVKGVDPKDMSLSCIVNTTEELMHAMELAESGDYSWYFAYVYQDVTFTKSVSLNASVDVDNGATVTVPRNVTVTIPDDHFMSFAKGTTLINEGTVLDQGELCFYNQATLNNKGNIRIDGVLASYGHVVNSGTVNCSAEGLLVDEGTWEGNLPVIAHKHDYETAVTPPTCTEEGYTTYTCSCGDSYTDNRVDALGHTEVIDAGTPPTCSEPGISDGKHCSVCEEVLEPNAPVEATGKHPYVNGICQYCGQERFPLMDVVADGKIDEQDALQVLWNTLFPAESHTPGWGDFTGDGKATAEDAVYVVWYTLFPQLYPV